jgi:hypothetical protein
MEGFMDKNSNGVGKQTSKMKVLSVYPTAVRVELSGWIMIWSGNGDGMLAKCYPYEKTKAWDFAWMEVQKRLLSKLEK